MSAGAGAGLDPAGLDSVGINLPEPWQPLPDEPDDVLELAARWDARWADDGVGRPARAARRALVQRVVDVASAPGATLAAATFGLARRAIVEQVAANDEPLDATCTITVVPAAVEPAHLLGPARRTAISAAVEIALAAGPAVRHRSLATADDDPAVRWLSDVYVVRPERWNDVVVVVELNTTALTVSAELGGLFADYVSTLTLLAGTDDTVTYDCPDDPPAWHLAAPTPALSVRLALVTPNGAAPLVASQPVVVGRGGDVVVDDPLVSRRHVQLWQDDGVVLCRDLASRNGTWRRRAGRTHPVRQDAPTVLLDGDELLTVGGTTLGALVVTGVVLA